MIFALRERGEPLNDYEMLRVIDFLERTRAPLRQALRVADDEPV